MTFLNTVQLLERRRFSNSLILSIRLAIPVVWLLVTRLQLSLVLVSQDSAATAYHFFRGLRL